MITVITEKETRKIIDIRENDTIENINAIKTDNVNFYIVDELPIEKFGEIFEITSALNIIPEQPKSKEQLLQEQIDFLTLQILDMQLNGGA